MAAEEPKFVGARTLWAPRPGRLVESAMAKFISGYGGSVMDYESFHNWSISDKGAFWRAVWDYTGVIGEPGHVAYVPCSERRMTGARFFPEASLNLAENLLRGDGNRTAVVTATECGATCSHDMNGLRAMVAKAADGLRGAGVVPGDAVAGIVTNRIEGLVAMLATLAVGATWTSCSPDFGTQAVLDRISQVSPKVLFATVSYRYGGKEFDNSERVSEVMRELHSLKLLVTIGGGGIASGENGCAHAGWGDFGRAGARLEFPCFGFSHPAYVLFTSGTTGAPKAIVHSAGGALLQHVKEHVLHGDVRPGDRLMWFTNAAWMMYHWMVSALACEAAIVLYDGAPILKTEDGGLDPSILWRIAEQSRVTHFGTSPRYLATLQKEDYRPGRLHDLSRLRSVLSAGAPVAPAQFDWVYDAVKQDMVFASISGGTEILGCFFLGSPIHPVRRGELTVKGLGMAANVMDERNAPLVGEAGDLVCTEPFPSMPVTFAGEGGYQRYMDTYFAARREIWTHGDLAEQTPYGSAVIHGRTDTTLKPGGVRIGVADIYAICERFEAVDDCLVFGLPVDGDEEIVLCIKTKDREPFSTEQAARLRAEIRDRASPRHVPHRIHTVTDIPYTVNGKRTESAAATVARGLPVKNRSSLSNAPCLDEYRLLTRETAL